MSLDILKAEQEIGAETETKVAPPPEAKPLSALVRHAEKDPAELLQHRFLCRGGGLLIVGPTGIGKSSFGMQAKILWALGRPYFEINPAKPLKSLLVQAENDDGDLAEMRDGVIGCLQLNDDEKAQAMANVLVANEDERVSMRFFMETVRPLLEKHRPDLLWIDPALSYLGGDVSSQKDVGAFLRTLLNPLLHEFACGGIVVHHTNKPSVGREKPEWNPGDFAYLGGGSAEWANWSRAILALRSLGVDSVYELRAGKRGSRLGWREADGKTKALAKFAAHNRETGTIFWREADPAEVPTKDNLKRPGAKDVVLPLVPLDGPILKDLLREKVHAIAVGWNRINPMIEELIREGLLFEWHEKRSGTNPQKLIARFPQPQVILPLN